jgi:hypothetical protein
MMDKQEIFIRSTNNSSSFHSARWHGGLEYIIGILDQALAIVNEGDDDHESSDDDHDTSTHDDDGDGDDAASNHQEQEQQQQQVPCPSPRLLGAEEEAPDVPLNNLVLVEDRDAAFLDVVDVLAAGEDEDEDALPRTNPPRTTNKQEGIIKQQR